MQLMYIEDTCVIMLLKDIALFNNLSITTSKENITSCIHRTNMIMPQLQRNTIQGCWDTAKITA